MTLSCIAVLPLLLQTSAPTALPNLTWIDIDADSRVDLVILDPGGDLRLLRNLGPDGFADETTRWGLSGLPAVTGLLAGDTDGDDSVDIVLGGPDGLRLLRQAGGAFVDATTVSGLGAVTDVALLAGVDANADGLADLHVVAAGRHRVFTSGPSGVFQELDLGLNTNAVSAALLGNAAAALRPGAIAEERPDAERTAERAPDVGRPPVDLGTHRGSFAATTGAPGALDVTVSGPTVSGTTLGELPPWMSGRECVDSLEDQAGGGCVQASSVPALGMLYPLGNELFIDAGTGNVGIGTLTPGYALEVAGKIISGTSNTSSGLESAVGGGASNIATGERSSIAGGIGNRTGYRAAVGGGDNNRATGNIATVSGGKLNDALQTGATVGGGENNVVDATHATIAGGVLNAVSGMEATVSGGRGNQAVQPAATVGGGDANTASGTYSTVAGGQLNEAIGFLSTIGGGFSNETTEGRAAICGGSNNVASGFSFIGGGTDNVASSFYDTVGGGRNNSATNQECTIAGGRGNETTGYAATVAGGSFNDATGEHSTVLGGSNNVASGRYSTVAGGGWFYDPALANVAPGEWATISGGARNRADGIYATVPGGGDNEATGSYSFAAGRHAVANHNGVFVWGDRSEQQDFVSTATNQFLIRAEGGVGIGTNAPQTAVHIEGGTDVGPAGGGYVQCGPSGGDNVAIDANEIMARNQGAVASLFLNAEGGNVILGDDGATGRVGIATDAPEAKLEVISEAGLDGFRVRVANTTRLKVAANGTVAVGSNLTPSYDLQVSATAPNGGTAAKPGGGSWSNSSDRRLKKNIEDLDGALETLLALRGVTFEYKDPASINELDGTRMGFIAQEVEEVIPDWVSEKPDGMKMVTVRGFEALAVEALREQQRTIADQADGLAVQAERIERLEAELARLGSVAEVATLQHEQLAELRAQVAMLMEGR